LHQWAYMLSNFWFHLFFQGLVQSASYHSVLTAIHALVQRFIACSLQQHFWAQVHLHCLAACAILSEAEQLSQDTEQVDNNIIKNNNKYFTIIFSYFSWPHHVLEIWPADNLNYVRCLSILTELHSKNTFSLCAAS
jgi:hypothetical protein